MAQGKDGKDIIQSKTAVGSAIFLIAYIFGGGHMLDADTQTQITQVFNIIMQHLQGIGVALGAALSIYGRLVSQHRITSVFGIKLYKTLEAVQERIEPDVADTTDTTKQEVTK